MTDKDDKSKKSFLDSRDVLAILGICLQAYGFYLIYPPLAFVIPGIEFLLVAVFSARGVIK